MSAVTASSQGLLPARRLGYVTLDTPDMDGAVAYFSNVIGLNLVARDPAQAVLATNDGIESVVLRPGEKTGLAGVSFQLAPTTDLSLACSALQDAGITASIRPGRTLGVEQSIWFEDPGGIVVELFTSLQFATLEIQQSGIAPIKLGHVARVVESPPDLAAFYERVLGFRRSDWCDDAAIFLRCGPDHHTINFFKGQPRLQHIAFQVKDWSELARSADHLRRWHLPLDWGPARHHIGHNMACYHSNADDVRVELFCEMDQMLDEELGFFDPRPWHEDRPQRPKNWGVTPRNAWTPAAP